MTREEAIALHGQAAGQLDAQTQRWEHTRVSFDLAHPNQAMCAVHHLQLAGFEATINRNATLGDGSYYQVVTNCPRRLIPRYVPGRLADGSEPQRDREQQERIAGVVTSCNLYLATLANTASRMEQLLRSVLEENWPMPEMAVTMGEEAA